MKLEQRKFEPKRLRKDDQGDEEDESVVSSRALGQNAQRIWIDNNWSGEGAKTTGERNICILGRSGGLLSRLRERDGDTKEEDDGRTREGGWRIMTRRGHYEGLGR